ncbi:MAG TPA: helix-turn-helix domain-containing protein [Candidatus Nitrosotenuis sp.]|nr:helix-turn-helix domain-containing protein [Candidatus Nitrosotenuis sp.]
MEEIKSSILLRLSRVSTVEDVAELVNLSVETVRRKFARAEGITLGRYIDLCKIVAMAEQLILSDEPCKLICYELGLRDDVGAKLFKKHTGMTMQQFREMYRPKFLATEKNPLVPAELLEAGYSLSIVERYAFLRTIVSNSLRQE